MLECGKSNGLGVNNQVADFLGNFQFLGIRVGGKEVSLGMGFVLGEKKERLIVDFIILF